MNDPNFNPSDDWLDRLWKRVAPGLLVGTVFTLMFIIPLGALGISILGYLKTGAWDFLTLASVTGWGPPKTDWVGLRELAATLLAQWVGWYSLALGFGVLWLAVSQ